MYQTIQKNNGFEIYMENETVEAIKQYIKIMHSLVFTTTWFFIKCPLILYAVFFYHFYVTLILYSLNSGLDLSYLLF